MWEGFVTVGRGGLWLALIAIILLVFTAGFLSAQLYAMIKRPAVVPQPKCLRLHCDDEKHMASWLRQRDYSLITNEMLHEMRQRTEFAHQRADKCERGESTGRHSKTEVWPGMAGKLSEGPE